MVQAIVNLAVPVIQNKVEAALDSYSATTTHEKIASATLREKLVKYVLKRMPTVYAATETPSQCSLETPINCFSREEQCRINDLIDEGIHQLLNPQQGAATSAQAISQDVEPAPSHWFG